MIGWNGLQVALTVIGGGVVAFWGLVGTGIVIERLREHFETRYTRRYWRTVHTRTCYGPGCNGRIWSRDVREYDPTVGPSSNETATCPACQIDSNAHYEIDLDSVTLDQIRSIDRDHTYTGAPH